LLVFANLTTIFPNELLTLTLWSNQNNKYCLVTC